MCRWHQVGHNYQHLWKKNWILSDTTNKKSSCSHPHLRKKRYSPKEEGENEHIRVPVLPAATWHYLGVPKASQAQHAPNPNCLWPPNLILSHFSYFSERYHHLSCDQAKTSQASWTPSSQPHVQFSMESGLFYLLSIFSILLLLSTVPILVQATIIMRGSSVQVRNWVLESDCLLSSPSTMVY